MRERVLHYAINIASYWSGNETTLNIIIIIKIKKLCSCITARLFHSIEKLDNSISFVFVVFTYARRESRDYMRFILSCSCQ